MSSRTSAKAAKASPSKAQSSSKSSSQLTVESKQNTRKNRLSTTPTTIRRSRKPLEDILAEVGVLINKSPIPVTPTPSSVPSPAPSSLAFTPQSASSFKKQSAGSVNITPVVHVTYEKSSQAGDEGIQNDPESTIQSPDPSLQPEINATIAKPKPAAEIKTEPQIEDIKQETVKYMSYRDKRKEMESEKFQAFFNRASLLVERVLSEKSQSSFDTMIDYTKADVELSGQEEEMKKISLKTTLYDSKLCKDRAISSIDWSYKHEELLLASYAGHSDFNVVDSQDPDGLVLVWNLHMPTRPEFKFHAPSTVQHAIFHPTQPTLIIGSTYNGQVVLWDTREKTMPVNRTSISSGHTNPVFALGLTPSTKQLHNIVSLSTDGQLCVWSDCMLDNPSVDLSLKDEKKVEITANSFAFPGRDPSTLVVGSDDGALHKVHLYDSADSNPIYETIPNAHHGPVTSIDFHPARKDTNKTIADVFLTSSFDWTAQLWSYKLNRSLLTFESSRDYVYDIKWSPRNAASFASVNGQGTFEYWNLIKDKEMPTIKIKAPGANALSRLQWNREGTRIATGDCTGNLFVYDLAPELWELDAAELSKFNEQLNKLYPV